MSSPSRRKAVLRVPAVFSLFDAVVERVVPRHDAEEDHVFYLFYLNLKNI